MRTWPARQTARANRGELREGLGIAVVHPTWDYGTITQEKRKSNSRKEKTHGGGTRSEGGGDSILLLIGSSRFCDHRLHLISCWLSSSGASVLFQTWIYLATAAKCCWDLDDTLRRSAWETNAGVFGTVPAGLNLFTTSSTLWWTLYNTTRSHRVTVLPSLKQFCCSVDQQLFWELSGRTVSFNILPLHVFSHVTTSRGPTEKVVFSLFKDTLSKLLSSGRHTKFAVTYCESHLIFFFFIPRQTPEEKVGLGTCVLNDCLGDGKRFITPQLFVLASACQEDY